MAKQFRRSELKIVILGLSITSSWGNGHAITYRGLVSELGKRGHDVLFLERDAPWYAAHRDLPQIQHGRIAIYSSLDELQSRYERAVRDADCVIVGSFVPDGIAVGSWVVKTAKRLSAFYDIDTPVTLADVERETCTYLNRKLIAQYGLYLSFTGGPLLRRIEKAFHSPCARVLYCSIDPASYFPEPQDPCWDIGYLGTYSADRQPLLEKLLLEPAKKLKGHRFVVAGPQYPDGIQWPENVSRVAHLPPDQHRTFYNAQRFTLNLTRADMIKAGYSPSIRLFESAACGTPIITDYWDGLESIFTPGMEVLLAHDTDDILRILRDTGDATRQNIGMNARRRVLREHTAAHRAESLEQYITRTLDRASADRQPA
jgi:spore maturation protein CgeB